jgi:hypothetical protein
MGQARVWMLQSGGLSAPTTFERRAQSRESLRGFATSLIHH